MNQTSFSSDFELVVGGKDGTTIAVHGELDSGTCEELLEAFHRAARVQSGTITLDLGGVTFIDSAGTRAVILIERSAREKGIQLRVTPRAARRARTGAA